MSSRLVWLSHANLFGVNSNYTILTSTFFSSNSGVYAKHEFPNVSHDPLLPCNLFKQDLDTIQILFSQTEQKYDNIRQLTNLHQHTMRSFHHLQTPKHHSSTNSRICLHLDMLSNKLFEPIKNIFTYYSSVERILKKGRAIYKVDSSLNSKCQVILKPIKLCYQIASLSWKLC